MIWRLCVIALILPACCLARNPAEEKQRARQKFDLAEHLREELNARPENQRTRREYQRVIDAYRDVYYSAPTLNKADMAVETVAELLAESGRQFHDPKNLESAVGQCEFLRREYPGSRLRVDALFMTAQIYKDDLKDRDHARAAFQEFLKAFPRSARAEDARSALSQLNQPVVPPHVELKQARVLGPQPAPAGRTASPVNPAPKPSPGPRPEAHAAAPPPNPSDVETTGSEGTFITGVRYWTTPNYTRVAVDLDSDVDYDAGRVPNPDRIFFDLHDTRLGNSLASRNIEIEDGLLRRIRIAQKTRDVARVVLELDDISDYSAFVLPNPSRLIIDLRGHGPVAREEERKTAPAAIVAKNEPPAAARRMEEAPRPNRSGPAIPDGAPAPAMSAKFALPEVSAPAHSANLSPQALPVSSHTGDGTTSPLKYEAVSVTPAEAAPLSAASSRSAGQRDRVAARESIADLNTLKPIGGSGKTVDPRLLAANQPPATADSGVPRARLPLSKHSQQSVDGGHEAQPTSAGDRSLTRALGLKIGRIIVDAGHGGHDTGTVGPDGLQEKDLTLDVALRLGNLLRSKLGADVTYTRKDDTFIPLEERTNIANQNQADLFISIHANSSPEPDARGVETYYLNFTSSPESLEVAARENATSQTSIHDMQELVKKIALKEKIDESREFAAEVQKSLWGGLAAKSPAIQNRGVKKAPFVVLIGANMPSILAEISFLSNPTDEHKMEAPDYRQKIAEYLYRGIARYISGLSGVKLAQQR